MTSYTMRRIIAPSQNPTGWQLLGSAELTGAAASMAISGLANRRFLQVWVWVEGFAIADYPVMTFNADTGTNYDTRLQENGAADVLTNNSASAVLDKSSGVWARFATVFIANDANKFKRCFVQNADGGYADNAPGSSFGHILWENAADVIASIQVKGAGGQNLLSGSYMRVYGSD